MSVKEIIETYRRISKAYEKAKGLSPTHSIVTSTTTNITITVKSSSTKAATS